jgi:hypothetical protein
MAARDQRADQPSLAPMDYEQVERMPPWSSAAPRKRGRTARDDEPEDERDALAAISSPSAAHGAAFDIRRTATMHTDPQLREVECDPEVCFTPSTDLALWMDGLHRAR